MQGRRIGIKGIFIGIVLSVLFSATGMSYADQPWFELPQNASPPLYGDILITRSSGQNDMKSVAFSHWKHRIKYTCRVCHFELDFQMKVNTTEITEEENANGEFCGACHNGKLAFPHTKKYCSRCHTGKLKVDRKKFSAVYRKLPRDYFGNKIDWVQAYRQRLIRPKQSLFDDNYIPMRFSKKLVLEADLLVIPAAVFPHREHVVWLDCSNCHPDIFNIKKKGTKHFSMGYILEKKFCGVCHVNVAFPLDDCKRCHPGIRRED